MVTGLTLALFVQFYQYSKDQEARRELIGKLIREYQSRIDALVHFDRLYPAQITRATMGDIIRLSNSEEDVVRGLGAYEPTSTEFHGVNMLNIMGDIDSTARLQLESMPRFASQSAPSLSGATLAMTMHDEIQDLESFAVDREILYDSGVIPLEYIELNRDAKLRAVGLDAAELKNRAEKARRAAVARANAEAPQGATTIK
jgi:hypothetical protein